MHLTQRLLKQWTKEDWDYLDPRDNERPKSERGRYHKASIRASLTPAQKAVANRRKREAGGVGSRVRYAGAELEKFRRLK
jgi:hypothetical protein